jgi:hypothetical protein
MTTVAQLQGVAPAQLAEAAKSMHATAVAQNRACLDYGEQVLRRVRRGDAWRDRSTPNAVSVVTVMALAFDTAATHMVTAQVALGALAIELMVSKAAMNHAVSHAEAQGNTVEDDGNVTVPPHIIPPPGSGGDAGHAHELGEAARTSELIKLALRRATAADDACGGVLARVAAVNVPMSAWPDPMTLADARQANEDAYALLGEAGRLLPTLQAAATRDGNRVMDREYLPSEVFLGFFKGLWDAGVGLASLAWLSQRAQLGDQKAIAQIVQGIDRLRRMGLGELARTVFDVDDLERGHIGEFLANAALLVMDGAGAVKSAGRLGRIAKAAALARRGVPADIPAFEIPPPRTAADGPPLETRPMRPGAGAFDAHHGVRHLTAAELGRTRLVVRDGRLYDVHGHPFDTADATSHWSGHGRAVFAMDRYGNLYAYKFHERGVFHHSSFFGGRPVAGAGEIEVHDGVLRVISRESGHYQPELGYHGQVQRELARQGIDLRDVRWGRWQPP